MMMYQCVPLAAVKVAINGTVELSLMVLANQKIVLQKDVQQVLVEMSF